MRPTKEMIEAGAKAAYESIFIVTDYNAWPDISGSVNIKWYREAARACYLAMTSIGCQSRDYISISHWGLFEA